MAHEDIPRNSNEMIIPREESGNLTGMISRMLSSLWAGLRSSLQRLAYGEQTSLGSNIQYVYDPQEKVWRSSGAAGTIAPLPSAPTDMSAPPQLPHHMSHPHCVAPEGYSAFAGVFPGAKTTRDRSAVIPQKSAVNMAELAHPVYAPSGSVVENPDQVNLTTPVAPEGPAVPVIRTSPFAS